MHKPLLITACLVLLGVAAAVRPAEGDAPGAGEPRPPSSRNALDLAGVEHSARKAFSCTFSSGPTDCGFKVQQKAPGRASVLGFGRDGGNAVRLHTRPGDSKVNGSGDMHRTDLYLA